MQFSDIHFVIILLWIIFNCFCTVYAQNRKQKDSSKQSRSGDMLANGSNCYDNKNCASGCCLFLHLRPFSGTCIAQALPGQICGSILPALSSNALKKLQLNNRKSATVKQLHNALSYPLPDLDRPSVDSSAGHHCSLCPTGCCCGHVCCNLAYCNLKNKMHAGPANAVNAVNAQLYYVYSAPSTDTGLHSQSHGPVPLYGQQSHQRHYSPSMPNPQNHPVSYGSLPATSMINNNNYGRQPYQHNGSPKPYISGYEQLMALLLMAQLQQQQPATVLSSPAMPMYPQKPPLTQTNSFTTKNYSNFAHNASRQTNNQEFLRPNHPTILVNVPTNFTFPEQNKGVIQESINQDFWNDKTGGDIDINTVPMPGNRIGPSSTNMEARFPERINHMHQKNQNKVNDDQNLKTSVGIHGKATIIYPEPPIILYPEKDTVYGVGEPNAETQDQHDVFQYQNSGIPYKNTVVQPIAFNELPERIQQQLRPFGYKDSPIMNEDPKLKINNMQRVNYWLYNHNRNSKNYNNVGQIYLHSKLAVNRYPNSSSNHV